MRSLYIRPGLSPVTWTEPTPVAASPLLAELIGYLGGDLAAGHRAHAEALLADLLTPVPVTTIGVRLPSAPVARQVAEALRADPADRRTLREWGRQVGASERTLARAFAAEAGVPFGRWRTLLRLQAALSLLAAGGSGRPGRGPGRLRHAERVRGCLPPRDRPDPGVVLQAMSPFRPRAPFRA